VREEADRRWRVRIGQRRPGQVDELGAVLVAEADEGQALPASAGIRDRDAGPRGDVGPARRPEGAQVCTNQVLEPLRRRRVARPHPLVGEAEPVRSTVPPGARRWHPDEVDPEAEAAHEPRRELAELPDGPRSAGKGIAQGIGATDHRRLADRAAMDPEARGASCIADPNGIAPELALRNDVDRRPHQRRLDHRPVLQRLGQRLAPEGLEPGPQPHVPGWRVLGLEAANLLDRLNDRHRRPLQQQLAREERPVQGAGREDPLGHDCRTATRCQRTRPSRKAPTDLAMRRCRVSSVFAPSTDSTCHDLLL